MEAGRQRVEAAAIRRVQPWADVLLAGLECDLTGKEKLTAAEDGHPRGEPLGVGAMVAAPGNVQAQTSPDRKPNPLVPAAMMRVASVPVRPRRLSRTKAPVPNGRRCGTRSRQCRPVRSSNSVASVGTGRASTRPSSSYRVVACSLRTAALSRSSPEGVSSISMDSASAAAESAPWMVRLPPAVPGGPRSTAESMNKGDQSVPDR
jgi:hypothetical protein